MRVLLGGVVFDSPDLTSTSSEVTSVFFPNLMIANRCGLWVVCNRTFRALTVFAAQSPHRETDNS